MKNNTMDKLQSMELKYQILFFMIFLLSKWKNYFLMMLSTFEKGAVVELGGMNRGND